MKESLIILSLFLSFIDCKGMDPEDPRNDHLNTMEAPNLVPNDPQINPVVEQREIMEQIIALNTQDIQAEDDDDTYDTFVVITSHLGYIFFGTLGCAAFYRSGYKKTAIAMFSALCGLYGGLWGMVCADCEER